jgi:hypothetical protein
MRKLVDPVSPRAEHFRHINRRTDGDGKTAGDQAPAQTARESAQGQDSRGAQPQETALAKPPETDANVQSRCSRRSRNLEPALSYVVAGWLGRAECELFRGVWADYDNSF